VKIARHRKDFWTTDTSEGPYFRQLVEVLTERPCSKPWSKTILSCDLSSLARVHMWSDAVLKKSDDRSPVKRWLQPSRSAACKKGNATLASSVHFSAADASMQMQPNANGMIWSHRIDLDPPILLPAEQIRSLLSTKMTPKLLCPKSPKFLHRDHPEKVLLEKDHPECLDDRGVARQSRIKHFEVY
jgi:hypothetical protein